MEYKFQFIALFKTFPLGGRCPRKGADEGKILPLISQKSKIFASFSPGRSFCACGAKEYDKSQFGNCGTKYLPKVILSQIFT